MLRHWRYLPLPRVGAIWKSGNVDNINVW